jgi:hypothetical protein
MFAILYDLGMVVADLLKSRARLEDEISLLQHHLNLAAAQANKCAIGIPNGPLSY